MNPIYMAGPSVTEDDINIVVDALRSGWYGNSAYQYVELFEASFAKFHERKFALMTPNCTTALHLLLAGLGVGKGDEVIVPECTWIGSAAGVSYVGAETVFADIDEVNWCITAETVERVISPKTKAVIAVDLYGNMPEWEHLSKLCRDRDVYLIEDAAEALGSVYKGTKAGKFGVASTFSFHRTKTITTGEGGMLLIDNEDLFERCKFLRDHGRQPGTYFNTEVTFKYMPFNVQAALGYAQFKRLNELVEKKRWILNSFKDGLQDIPDIFLNPEPEDGLNGAWAPALVFGKSHGVSRDVALEELPKLGFPVRPFFYPLSSLPAYPNRDTKGRMDSPVAYSVSERGINLPCALNLEQEHIDTIVSGVRRFLGFSNL